MKTRFNLLIMLLLLLPLVLVACGGEDADTAKKYLEAVGASDKDEAAKYVCDDSKILYPAGSSAFPTPGFEPEDLKCENEGDDVKCTFNSEESISNSEGGDTVFYVVATEVTFTMKDGKVCEIKKLVIDDTDWTDLINFQLGNQ